MKHMEYAISILKSEIRNQKYLLEHGDNLPETEERIMENLQMLNHAVNDITNKFIPQETLSKKLDVQFHTALDQYLKDRGWK